MTSLILKQASIQMQQNVNRLMQGQGHIQGQMLIKAEIIGSVLRPDSVIWYSDNGVIILFHTFVSYSIR